jgi:hypothetical protein
MTLYRQQFVDRLAECAGADDDLSHAICQSVVPFLRANDMDEYGAVSRTSCGSSPPSSSFSGCRRSAPPVRVETLVPPRHKDVDRQMIVDLRRMLARAADVFVRPSQLGARSGPLPQG